MDAAYKTARITPLLMELLRINPLLAELAAWTHHVDILCLHWYLVAPKALQSVGMLRMNFFKEKETGKLTKAGS